MNWAHCNLEKNRVLYSLSGVSIRAEMMQRILRYSVIQSSTYVLWYRKIDEDMHRFCMICSIILRLPLRNLNILKNSIFYMYRIVVVSWDLYRDTYRIVAVLSRFTLVSILQLWLRIYEIVLLQRWIIPATPSNPPSHWSVCGWTMLEDLNHSVYKGMSQGPVMMQKTFLRDCLIFINANPYRVKSI